MKKVGVVGYGRFGQLLAELSSSSFNVHIVEIDPEKQKIAKKRGYKIMSFNQLEDMDYIFLAVPISRFESVVKKLAPLTNYNQVVIDVCSVKIYPSEIMKLYLKNAQILASHPMFGPDGAKSGLIGMKIAFCPIRISNDVLIDLKNFWVSKGVQVVETTPQKHDKDSVYSLGFIYSLERIVLSMQIPDLVFTTKSFDAIKTAAELSANDSEQLFHDMLLYNPYFTGMKEDFEKAIAKIDTQLKQIAKESVKDKY